MNTREKLLLVWAFTVTILLVVGGIIALQMLQPASTRQTRLGSFDDFPVGSVTLLECDRSVRRCAPSNISYALTKNNGFPAAADNATDIARVWLTHDAVNEWHAFSAVSTHLGCLVKWNEARERFEDPCGGAIWTREGKYHDGPAPRDLDWYPVRAQDGSVMIDFKLTRGEPIPQ